MTNLMQADSALSDEWKERALRGELPGARAYREEEAPAFRGRSGEAGILTDLVCARNEVVLQGPAGRGKTSLVHAGLLPLLRKRKCRVLPVARVAGPVPANDGPDGNSFVAHVLSWWGESDGPMDFAEVLKKHRWNGRGRPAPLVAVFDPFDDFFTAPKTTDRERRRFFAQLGAALTNDSSLRVLFVIRDEFVGSLMQFAGDLPERLEARFQLDRLSADAANRVLTASLAPVEEMVPVLLAARLAGDDGLGRSTESDPHGPFSKPIFEPQLLQLAMGALTAGRARTEKITYPRAEQFCQLRMGWDANRYLEELYESTIKRSVLGPDVPEPKLRRLMSALATAPLSATLEGERAEFSPMLRELAHAHPLLVIDPTQQYTGVKGLPEWYELAHETLAPAILSANAKWAKQREGQDSGRRATAERYRSELEARATRYKQEGSRALLKEAELNVAEAWSDSPEVRELKLTSEPIRELIQKSRLAIAQRALEKSTRQKRGWAAAAIVGFLLCVAAAMLAWLALIRGARAEYTTKLLKGQQEVIAAFNDVPNDPRKSAMDARNRLEKFDENYPKESSAEEVIQQREVLHRSMMTWLNLALQADRTHVELKDVGKGGEVNGVAFGGPNGNLVATACSDGKIRVWGLGDDGHPTGIPKVLDDGDLPEANAVAFHGQSTWLASSHDNGVVVVWKLNPDGGCASVKRLKLDDQTKELPKRFKSSGVAWSTVHQSRILAASGSWDGKFGSVKGIGLRVWKVDDQGEPKPLRVPEAAQRSTTAITFCASHLITAHSDGLRKWTVKGDAVDRIENQSLEADMPVPVETAETNKLAVGNVRLMIGSQGESELRSIVAAASTDNCVRMWDVEKNKRILMIRHPDPVRGVAFHPSGYQLATAGRDGRARIWRMIGLRWPTDTNGEWTEWAFTGREAQTLVGHTNILTDVAYGPMRWETRPPFLATASDDGTARLWDVSAVTGPSCILGLAECTGFAFAPDLRWLACADQFGNRWEPLILPLANNLPNLARGANTELERWTNRKYFEGKQPTIRVAFAPENRQLATLDKQGKLRLWPLGCDAPISEASNSDDVSFWHPLKPRVDLLFCHVTYCGDGSRVAVSVNRSTVSVFSTTGAAATPSRLVSLLNLAEEDLKLRDLPPKEQNKTSTYGIALNQSGDRLALGCQGQVRVWSVPRPNDAGDFARELGRFRVNDQDPPGRVSDLHCNGVQFSPDGTLLAAGCGDQRVRIWNLKDPSKPLWKSPRKGGPGSMGHSSEVRRIAFDPEHPGRIASGDADGLVCVWDWQQPNGQGVPEGQCGPIYQFTDVGPIEALTFGIKSSRLATATAAGHIRIYVLDEAELISAARVRLGESKK